MMHIRCGMTILTIIDMIMIFNKTKERNEYIMMNALGITFNRMKYSININNNLYQQNL